MKDHSGFHIYYEPKCGFRTQAILGIVSVSSASMPMVLDLWVETKNIPFPRF
jgi:hypothetical protein